MYLLNAVKKNDIDLVYCAEKYTKIKINLQFSQAFFFKSLFQGVFQKDNTEGFRNQRSQIPLPIPK